MTNPATTDTTADEPLAFRIETASAESLPYVLSSWGRAIETLLEATPQPGFLKAFAPMQARLIKRSRVLTAITGDGKIGGFIVYEPAQVTIHETVVLHWIATRKEHRAHKEQRGKGIGKALAEAAMVRHSGTIITSWTPSLRYLGLARARYTPFWMVLA